ncbi:hypothetical protein TTHERM_00078910 (macronuclear) [Tetrahymena thermophila SB210]|uniref:Uncharacterized protein n=1 Tax=Tetrahymena thermophila (strain SB210) TaxID=312017 RepID=Q23FX3_TETTS|nr:hypothetical protein TTHERM_00078910 [Tetrahymena thermophila SB210]EAR95487.1 hypothetical protein TTHERM_00078910 [Tetrahymena thermophila SB210]|eukprot:XP_001015732.1 hypothetical protein TTHERM_00078910 [Tetrahymena thermophila SB210]
MINKYQKILLDVSTDLNLTAKEKALAEKNYVFPSVDSLTNLSSTKVAHSESYLNLYSHGKSLQNIDSSNILDSSMAHNKYPHSSVNLSQMKSIMLNNKLAKREKKNFEQDQRKIFESHLAQISKQNNVIDQMKASLPTLSQELLKEKMNGVQLPPIYSGSSPHISLAGQKKRGSNRYISPNEKQTQKQSIYSKSVQPTQRNQLGNDNLYKQKKADDIFDSLMKSLSIKKKMVAVATAAANANKETDNSQIYTPSNKNEQSILSTQQKEQESTQNLSQRLNIPDLDKISDKNQNRKFSDLFSLVTKNITQFNSPKNNQNETPMNNNQSVGRRSVRFNRKGPMFYEYEDLYQNGQLGSNIEDKFNFFKKTPVGSIITISKKSMTLKELQSPKSKNQTESSPQINNSSQERKKSNRLSSYLSQFSQAQTKREEELKNKQVQSTTKIPQITQANNNQYLDILKKQAHIQKMTRQNQDKKFCQMSKRMSNFFQEPDNFQIWERYVLLCRDFKRFIDVLFKIEKNQNKNMTYLTRLAGTKKYLINEIIDQQFSLIHFGVIETLENTLISENTLKSYFKVDQDLKSIITDIYIKDLSYINGLFEVYLNSQQIIQSSKISEIIQTEYKMIKQKEKDLIFDQFDSNGIKNLNIKKSYQFFDDYLYNIQPRRNTYKEILDFERNFGQFQYISQIDRDMFQNLEKSYNNIRQSNKQ